MWLEQHIKTEFWKEFYTLLIKERNLEKSKELMNTYMYYSFNEIEKKDIINIWVNYIEIGKLRNENAFFLVLLQFLEENKTGKLAHELMSILSQYFVKKVQTKFEIKQINLISRVFCSALTKNTSRFWKDFFTLEKKVTYSNWFLTLISSLLDKENEKYKYFWHYWVLAAKHFNSQFLEWNKSKRTWDLPLVKPE